MTRKYKLLLTAVVIPVLVALVIWAQATLIAEWVLSGIAHSLGAGDIRISVSNVSSRQIEMADISFTYDFNDTLVTVSVKEAVARYNIQALRAGRIHSIDADNADITLHSRKGQTPRPVLTTLEGMLSLLDLDIGSILPLDKATIGIYQLTADALNDGVTGSFQLQRHTDTLTSVLLAQTAGVAPLRLEFMTMGPGLWEVLVAEQEAPGKFLGISLSKSGGRLNVESRLDLGAIPAGLLSAGINGVIHVNGQLRTSDAPRQTIELDLDANAEAIAGDGYSLATVAAAVRGELFSEDDQSLILNGEAVRLVIGSLEAGRISTGLVSIRTSAVFRWDERVLVELLPGSALEAREVVIDDLATTTGFNSTFSATLDAAAESRFSIGGGSTLSIESLEFMGSNWPRGLDISLTKELSLASMGGVHRLISPTTITSPGFSVDYDVYSAVSGTFLAKVDTLEIGLENALAKGVFSADTLQLGQGEFVLRLRDVEQAVTYSDGSLTASGTSTDTLRNLSLSSALRHDIVGGEGEIEIQAPEIMPTAETPLASYIQPLEIPLIVITGKIDARLAANWRLFPDKNDLQASLTMTADSLGGAYQNLFFSGLSTTLNIELLPVVRTADAQRLNISDIDVGLPVTDVFVHYRLSGSPHGPYPTIELPLIGASILGGEIIITDTQFDPNLEENTLVIGVNGVSLGEAVALHQLEDIEATGMIDGSLPVTLSDDGVSMRSGLLYAREPGGRISYTADTSALENAALGTDIVFNALKNFNYTSLRVEPDYDSSGLLLLGLKLQGSNPDLGGGRQVNLNVNLEQNVTQLLQSLRFVDGLNEAIDNRVRQYYRQLNEPGPG